MAKKYNNLEKIITITGLGLVAFAIVASTFGALTNQRFISDFLDIIYYCRFVILLGGGFAIGYAFSRPKQPRKASHSPLFTGTAYSLLAFITYTLQDSLRALVLNPLELTYPWEKIVFLGGPIITLLILLLVAFMINRKAYASKPLLSWTVIVAFALQQIHMIATSVIVSSSAVLSYDSLWIALLGIITLPLFVAAVAYTLLGKIKSFVQRAFYASLLGTIYIIITMLAWEFRTNPQAEATYIFGTIITICNFLFMTLLLWRVRVVAR